MWQDESDKETLVFWFEFERARLSNSIVDVEFIDPERHRKYHTEGWLPVQTLPNGRMIGSCAFPKWPRNERTLIVRVLLEEPASTGVGEGKGVKIGELTVKNPGYRR